MRDESRAAALLVLEGKFGVFGSDELKRSIQIVVDSGEASAVRLVQIVAAACEMADLSFRTPSIILNAIYSYEG